MEGQEAPTAASAMAAAAEQQTDDAPPPAPASSTQHEPPTETPPKPPPTDTSPPEVDQGNDISSQTSQAPFNDHPKDAPETVSVAPEPVPNLPSMATPQHASTTTPSRGGSASARGSRSSKRVSFPIVRDNTPSGTANATPPSAPRGRPPGRPRGSRARGPTRASTRGSRGGKRKRADDENDDLSSDSEIYAPTTTKSGRSVQKPTSFVPPPQPSPQQSMPAFKKKRTYRRNPESAVCKICLRGVSPASNMIVFCDGCNVPYHRYCHQPPIDQSVIDEVDKEWYCRQCEKARIQPVSEEQVVDFVAAEGASAEERQKYFSSLPPGLLVTLLTKATTLHPDLPVFDPSFQPSTNGTQHPITNGSSHPPIPSFPAVTNTIIRDMNDSDDDQYGSDEHPKHYPRPGQGLMNELHSEKKDLHFLVDDENSKGVFTHIYRDEANTGAQDAKPGAER